MSVFSPQSSSRGNFNVILASPCCYHSVVHVHRAVTVWFNNPKPLLCTTDTSSPAVQWNLFPLLQMPLRDNIVLETVKTDVKVLYGQCGSRKWNAVAGFAEICCAKTSKPLRSLPSVQGCTCVWVVLGGCQECVDWRMTHSWNPNAYLFKRQEDDLLLWWWLRSVSWRNASDFGATVFQRRKQEATLVSLPEWLD